MDRVTCKCRECGKVIGEFEKASVDGCSFNIYPTICDKCDEKRSESIRKDVLRASATSAGLPFGFWSFDSQKGNNELLEWCKENSHTSIWLMGDTGLCKTRSLVRTAIIKLWQDDNLRVMYIPTCDWLRQICGMMGNSNHSSDDVEWEIYRAKNVDILIIDDIGQEKITARGAELLFTIIDYRVMAGNRIWATTQTTAEELDLQLGERKGRAIRRRLAEVCTQWGGSMVTESENDEDGWLDNL